MNRFNYLIFFFVIFYFSCQNSSDEFADFTIVDVDVLNANPKAILNGKVLQTIVNGKVKYDAGLLD